MDDGELGPIDLVVIGYPAGSPMTGEAVPIMLDENRWAAPFAAAVRRTGGRLLASERIGAQDLMDALEALEA